jgi:hypothetical protein
VTPTSIDEPVPASTEAGAGSTHSAHEVDPVRDVLRALVCGLLVAGSVASPVSATLFAPFVPALVAIRLLRSRAGAMRFLALATAGSIAAGLAASVSASIAPAALLVALLLVPGLGLLHVAAARRDPATSTPTSWPEPRADSGLTPTVFAWLAGLVLVCAVVAATSAAPPLDELGRDAVRDAYSFYTRECADGGSLEAREEFCAETLAQRDAAIRIAEDYDVELLAAFLAIFAFGAAGTAHLVVLVRAGPTNDRVRPRWPLASLELHWSFTYALAVGLIGWMVLQELDADGLAASIARAGSVALAVLGALALVAQGLGLAAWNWSRVRRPIWYRVLVVLAALLATPIAIGVLFCLGIVDQALHPRRRAERTPSSS